MKKKKYPYVIFSVNNMSYVLPLNILSNILIKIFFCDVKVQCHLEEYWISFDITSLKKKSLLRRKFDRKIYLFFISNLIWYSLQLCFLYLYREEIECLSKFLWFQWESGDFLHFLILFLLRSICIFLSTLYVITLSRIILRFQNISLIIHCLF